MSTIEWVGLTLLFAVFGRFWYVMGERSGERRIQERYDRALLAAGLCLMDPGIKVYRPSQGEPRPRPEPER